jgi:hypothetical protein
MDNKHNGNRSTHESPVIELVVTPNCLYERIVFLGELPDQSEDPLPKNWNLLNDLPVLNARVDMIAADSTQS